MNTLISAASSGQLSSVKDPPAGAVHRYQSRLSVESAGSATERAGSGPSSTVALANSSFGGGATNLVISRPKSPCALWELLTSIV